MPAPSAVQGMLCYRLPWAAFVLRPCRRPVSFYPPFRKLPRRGKRLPARSISPIITQGGYRGGHPLAALDHVSIVSPPLLSIWVPGRPWSSGSWRPPPGLRCYWICRGLYHRPPRQASGGGLCNAVYLRYTYAVFCLGGKGRILTPLFSRESP